MLMLLLDTSGDAEHEREAIRALVQRRVDGMLYATWYEGVFDRVPAARFLLNSMRVTAAIVVLGLLVNRMAGFALSRMQWRRRKIIVALVIATSLWPSMVGHEECTGPAMIGVQYFQQLAPAWGEIMAYSTLVTIPVPVFFLAFQRSSATRIAATGVKG